MTITKITRAWAATTGDRTNKGRTYTANYRVETDSTRDQTKTIIDYFGDHARDPDNEINLPYLNSSYSFGDDLDPLALCHSVAPTREDGSQKNWIVEFQYKTAEQEEDETQEDEKGEATNDPLQWNWEIDISFADYSRPVTHATYRGGHTANNFLKGFERADGVDDAIIPPMNSAGTIFDPPLEKNALRQIFRFKKYRHEYPDGMVNAWRAVNAKGFGIKVKDPKVITKDGKPRRDQLLLGWHFEPFQVQVASANAAVVRKNNMTLWQVSSEIHADYEFGFRVRVVDRGIMALGNAGAPDGMGGACPQDQQPGATGIPEERAMRDQLGNALQEPVLLDGNGQPLAKGKPAVYLTWSIYPEVNFRHFREWIPIG